MRVLVAGASGALGVPLTRLLVARGHSVVGLIQTLPVPIACANSALIRLKPTHSIVRACSAP